MEIITTKIPQNEIIQKAIEVLESGGLVVYPTETCYGIGADATNQSAINKLLQYKTRREGKPLSVVMAEKEMAKEYIELNDMAENIYDNYLPGPLTVVSKSLGKVVQGVESEASTLGVRVPDYPLILEISKKFKKPFTATSANMSYKPKPYSIDQLLANLPEKKQKLIDLVIDAGELPKNEASTVVDTTLNTMNVLREGKIQFQDSLDNSELQLSAHSLSEEDTQNFGSTVMLKYIDVIKENPLVFLLSGELGAGKTQFTKGIAKQLKIGKLVKSPTYNILNEYEFGKTGKLIHIDVWKIYSWEEFMQIGVSNYLEKGNVLAIEWGDKFFAEMEDFFLSKDAKILKVNFEHHSDSERIIKVF